MLPQPSHSLVSDLLGCCAAGMDLTPVPVKEEKEDGPPADPNAQESAADAEALLGRRVALLVDTTSATVFSYICQVCSWPAQSGHALLCACY